MRKPIKDQPSVSLGINNLLSTVSALPVLSSVFTVISLSLHSGLLALLFVAAVLIFISGGPGMDFHSDRDKVPRKGR